VAEDTKSLFNSKSLPKSSAILPRCLSGASERGGGCKKSLYPALLRGAVLEQLPFSKGDNNVAKGFLRVFTSFT